MNEPMHTVKVKIEPGILMLVGVAAGFLYGLLLVFLDRWLRFPDVALFFNWREGLLTACVLGVYSALLGWVMTTFWRSIVLWLVALITAPLVTGLMMAWNRATGTLGLDSDWVLFMPIVTIFHLAILGLCNLYWRMALKFTWRRGLAFSAIPVIMAMFVFFTLGRIRWTNVDALDIVAATDAYAASVFTTQDYTIELVSIRYQGETVTTGTTRVRAEDVILRCRVRLFLQETETSCQTEEE